MKESFIRGFLFSFPFPASWQKVKKFPKFALPASFSSSRQKRRQQANEKYALGHPRLKDEDK